MRGEVTVAQVEPRLGAEVPHRLEAPERVVRDAPAAHRVEPACERVHHRSEEHTSELQSRLHLVCRLLLEKKKNNEAKETQRATDEYASTYDQQARDSY